MDDLLRIPKPHAPHKKYGEVNALCRRLAPNSKAVYLPVEPIDGAQVNECFVNVDLAISRKGGQVQYGWQIWESLPGLLLEAEFHAVWLDENGKCHDVTPKELPDIKKMLFLPDPTRKYEGKQVMSVFAPVKKDQLLTTYVDNTRRYLEAINRGDLANYHGTMASTDELRSLQAETIAVLRAIARKYY